MDNLQPKRTASEWTSSNLIKASHTGASGSASDRSEPESQSWQVQDLQGAMRDSRLRSAASNLPTRPTADLVPTQLQNQTAGDPQATKATDPDWSSMNWGPLLSGADVRNRDAKSQISNASIAQVEAETLVNEARTQARKIIQDAEQQAATMKAEAHQIGRAQAQAELQTRIAALESLVVEVENWRQSVLDGSEREVIELVLALGRKLFGRGLRLPAEILHESFSEALVKARPLGDLRFHLNPVDLERLGEAWQGEQELRFGKRIELVPDAQVLPGGCLIEGQFGEVDGQADAKWQRVEAFFSNPEELGR